MDKYDIKYKNDDWDNSDVAVRFVQTLPFIDPGFLENIVNVEIDDEFKLYCFCLGHENDKNIAYHLKKLKFILKKLELTVDSEYVEEHLVFLHIKETISVNLLMKRIEKFNESQD